MKKYKIILLLTSILSLSGCNDVSGSWNEISATSNIPSFAYANKKGATSSSPFNTVMYLRYFVDDNKDVNLDNLTSLYNDEIVRLHKLFDRHYYYYDDGDNQITNVRVINDSYGSNTPVKVEKELFDLIKLGVEAFSLTDGYFNIFTGSYTDFWSSTFDALYNYEELKDIDPYYNLEKKNELEQYALQVPKTIEDINKQIVLDENNLTITFNNIHPELDIKYRPIISVGGIAKGFATDLVKQKLIDNGYNRGMLFSGGSSISSLSTPIHSKDVKGQSLSIVNPETSTTFTKEAAFSISVSKEFSFSTSGNYTTNQSYRFLDDEGNLIYRHHIINPYTGYPECFHRSVSLLSYKASNAMMDICSTAFMNLSVEDGLKLKEKLKDYSIELFYLDQQGYNDNATFKVVYTSDVDGTFSANENIEKVYEK